MHYSNLLATLSLVVHSQHLLHTPHRTIAPITPLSSHYFELNLTVHFKMANYNPIYYNIQQSLMKIFAGTYQGNVFILQGTPTDLKIKVVKPVSEVDPIISRTQSEP